VNPNERNEEAAMPSTTPTLTARLADVVRRNMNAYVPWSPLAGLGRAGELAALHPAFATAARSDHRFSA
jgi:hypothetical protein